MLTPRNCGHTFCATCILKWFFSRMHKGCGGWHEAVDCPLCRSPLPHTPDRTPRSNSSFPFTPNRIAEIAIRGLMNTISHELASASVLASHPLSDWSEGGHGKQEWSKRERCVTSSDSRGCIFLADTRLCRFPFLSVPAGREGLRWPPSPRNGTR